jgi:Acyl-coenzyme A:6-aminopenicillanic acid acyl-transferase
MAVASGPNAEVIGGVPLVSVIGTPRTMGEHLGSRLKPRLQVLSQYLADQLCTHARPGGHNLTPKKLRELLEPSIPHLQRCDPSLWMELDAMARSSELPVADLLLIHGYGDLLSYLGCQVAPQASTFVAIDSTHTQDGGALMALCWYLDPALFPYLTLLRRIPTHGPATLCLTLAGLGPVAGLSEAGIAVAFNEIRVRDGVSGNFSCHQVSSMLSSPGFDDAQRRAQSGPRHGGGALHGLSGKGERFTVEFSGQQVVRLSDPLPNAPRVHTNHPLSETLIPLAGTIDNTSKMRLEQIAGQVVAVNGVTPTAMAKWFGFDQETGSTKKIEADSERVPISLVLVVLDPHGREMHIRRSGLPSSLETIKL